MGQALKILDASSDADFTDHGFGRLVLIFPYHHHWTLLVLELTDDAITTATCWDSQQSPNIDIARQLADTLCRILQFPPIQYQHRTVYEQTIPGTCGVIAAAHLGHHLGLWDVLSTHVLVHWHLQYAPENSEELQAAGPQDSEVRSELSALLLTKGVPADTVLQRVEFEFQKLGTNDIRVALQQRNPWQALKAIASRPASRFRWITSEELSQHVTNRARTQFGAHVPNAKAKKTKTSGAASSFGSQIAPDSLVIPDGIFLDPDDLQVPQLPFAHVGAQKRGVAIATAEEAMRFAADGCSISTDALALITTAEIASTTTTLDVTTIRYPVLYTGTNEPILLTGSMLQLGDVPVHRVKKEVRTQPDDIETVTLRVSAYKDEFPQPWDQFVQAPFKTIVKLVVTQQQQDMSDMKGQLSSQTEAVQGSIMAVKIDLAQQLDSQFQRFKAWHSSFIPQLDASGSSTDWYRSFGNTLERSLDHFVASEYAGQLPKRCRGRAKFTEPVKKFVTPPTLKVNRPGEEPIRSSLVSTAVRQWCRQLRRLQSMVHACNACNTSVEAESYKVLLWAAIRRAPGFWRSFAEWWPHRAVQLHGLPAIVQVETVDTAKVECDYLLCAGQVLEQEIFVTDLDRVQQELVSLWQPRWNTAVLSQEETTRISAFVRAFVPAGSLPFRPITVHDWTSALRRYRPRAAKGPDGVAIQDLRSLHPRLTQRLVGWLNLLEAGGTTWPDQLLEGVVISLAKTIRPMGPDEYRPVVVYSIIFRTWSAIRARAIFDHIAPLMQNHAYGFLPGRETLQYLFALQSLVEISTQSDVPVCGAAVDLQKCFNNLQRLPVFSEALLRIPDATADFQVSPHDGGPFHLFSDGSCFHHEDVQLTTAAWAVVQQRDDRLDCIAAGHVPGIVQSVNRAELTAAISAVRLDGKCSICLWTDSKYVSSGLQILL
ncbi:unnamed protein product, partial [Effrenium voratum]